MNDLTSLVDSEIGVIAPKAGEPLIVSVGTGTAKLDIQPEASNRRRFCKGGLLYQLYEAFMASMSSKRYWRFGENFYRLDVQFDERELELDNVNQIPTMAIRAEEQFCTSSSLDKLASQLTVAHFHFEFEDVPRRMRGQLTGVGYILCDLKYGHPAYDALLDQLSRDRARFYFNGSAISGRVGDRSFRDTAGNIRKRVEFVLAWEDISICLKIEHSLQQHICGSPFPISVRIRAQNLDAVFGQLNHRKRVSLPNFGSTNPKRRRNRR
jgi:hypothetical protein